MRKFPSVRKNSEYQEIYHHARSKATGLLVMYAADGSCGHTRIGISVSKRVGNSVVRHTFVRRIRAIFQSHYEETAQGKDIIVVARNQAGKASYQKLDEDYVKLLKGHHLLKNRNEEEPC